MRHSLIAPADARIAPEVSKGGRRRDLEIFEAASPDWWDPAGPLAGLHALNPFRSEYFRGWLGKDGAPPGFPARMGGGASPGEPRTGTGRLGFPAVLRGTAEAAP